MSGIFRSITMQSKVSVVKSCSASVALLTSRISHFATAQQLRARCRAGASSSSTTRTRRTPGENLRFQSLQCIDELFALRPVSARNRRRRAAALPADSRTTEMMCTGMCRVRGLRFNSSQDVQAGIVGQLHVEQNRLRLVVHGRREPSAAPSCTMMHWKPCSCARSCRMDANGTIVFDDQDAPRLRRKVLAIVGSFARGAVACADAQFGFDSISVSR